MKFSANYQLREIKNPSYPDAINAVDIYMNTTHPCIRTDSNAIFYWLENYHNIYDDKLCALAFYMNDIVIGFAQLCYFIEEKIVVIDYVSIDPGYRKHNVFFEFCDHIFEYIKNEFRDYLFIVTELAKMQNPTQKCDNFEIMSRLLGMVGFCELDVDYVQLELSSKNHESFLEAGLFVNPRPTGDFLKKETVCEILHVLYIKHYLRWYEVQPRQDYDEYKIKAHQTYKTSSKKLKKNINLKSTETELLKNNNLAQPTALRGASFSWPVFYMVSIFSSTLIIVALLKLLSAEKSDFIQLFLLIFLSFLMITGIILPATQKTVRQYLTIILKIWKNK